MKELEGKVVYIQSSDGTIVKATVIKVARVFTTFAADDGYEFKYRFKGRALSEGNNRFTVYASELELKQARERLAMALSIERKFRWPSTYKDIDHATMTAVAKLLGIIEE